MTTTKKFDLRSLQYSPDKNPLLEGTEIKTKTAHRVSTRSNLVNPETGEVAGYSAIHVTKLLDDTQFVKIFSQGIKASFNLTRTAHRVFQVILDEYEKTPMTKGYADAIYLAWFNNGLCGREVDMSEYTWKRGLKELLEKGFLAPRAPDMFWVNPALFFKGDRVAFVNEYRRRGEGDSHLQEELIEK